MRTNFRSVFVVIGLVAFALAGFAFGRIQMQLESSQKPVPKDWRETKRTVFATKFADLVETQKSAKIQVDYAFLLVTYPRSVRPVTGIQSPDQMPKPYAHAAKEKDLAVDPVAAVLSDKSLGDDSASWRKAVNNLSSIPGPTKIEVVDVGSVGYGYQGPGSIRPLVASMKASPKDPIRASYLYEFLLCQSKGDRIGGLQRYKQSDFLNTIQFEWSPTDFENGKLSIEKKSETLTSCSLIIFRVGAKDSLDRPYGATVGGTAGTSAPHNLDRAALRQELLKFEKLRQTGSTSGIAIAGPKLD